MAELTFGPESPDEYFRQQVQLAMEHQQLVAHELTEFYVTKLLTRFVRPSTIPKSDAALGVRLVKALQTQERDDLRKVGDESLFLSGFFSDSLKRSLVDVDYYISLGEYAYGSIPARGDALGEVFEELAGKFAAFVAVLDEVSAKSWLTSDKDILRLYEKWLRTRSRRSAELLAKRGILPNASIPLRPQ